MAQSPVKTDSVIKTFTPIEMMAEFPGGRERFSGYVIRQIRYPEILSLIGLNGQLKVSFTVDEKGKTTNIVPLSHVGYGLEEQLVSIISRSPLWVPAVQNGRQVKQSMVYPVTLNFPKTQIVMSEFKKANADYLFQIKDTIYDIDHATPLLGETFSPTHIDTAVLYTGTDKFNLKKKTEIWLVKMKNQ